MNLDAFRDQVVLQPAIRRASAGKIEAK